MESDVPHHEEGSNVSLIKDVGSSNKAEDVVDGCLRVVIMNSEEGHVGFHHKVDTLEREVSSYKT